MEEKEVIKVGDLVETCQMLPGFVTEVDGDSCSVFIPGKHEFWAGEHHDRDINAAKNIKCFGLHPQALIGIEQKIENY